MKKILHLSHVDLDGYGCQWVSKVWALGEFTFFNANYGEELETTLRQVITKAKALAAECDEVKILITDLNLSLEQVNNLDDLRTRGIEVEVIDHHPVDFDVNDQWYHLDTTRCATKQYFDRLDDGIATEYERNIVNMIDAADRFDKTDMETFRMGRALNDHMFGHKTVATSVPGLFLTYMVTVVAGTCRLLEDRGDGGRSNRDQVVYFDRTVQEAKWSLAYNGTVGEYGASINANGLIVHGKRAIVEIDGRAVKVLYGYDLPSPSDVANEVFGITFGVDLCVFFSKSGGVSFRSTTRSYAGDAAKLLGGGGHPNAAGAFIEGVKNAPTAHEAIEAGAAAFEAATENA